MTATNASFLERRVRGYTEMRGSLTTVQSPIRFSKPSKRRVWRDVLPIVLLGVALLCAVSAGILLFGGGDSTEDPPVANESAQLPGTAYAGIVGAQQAEVQSEYRVRDFESRLDRAATDEERAEVIAAERTAIDARVEELETRKTDVQAARGNETAYRVRVTSHVSHSLTLQQRLERVTDAAETLEPSLREEHGLSSETLEALESQIDALTTPEMVDAARQVAGDDVGTALDNDDHDDDDDDGDDDGDDDDDDDDGGDENDDDEDDDE